MEETWCVIHDLPSKAQPWQALLYFENRIVQLLAMSSYLTHSNRKNTWNFLYPCYTLIDLKHREHFTEKPSAFYRKTTNIFTEKHLLTYKYDSEVFLHYVEPCWEKNLISPQVLGWQWFIIFQDGILSGISEDLVVWIILLVLDWFRLLIYTNIQIIL